MRDRRQGMTLIEVAIAMSILLVVFLALMQTALVSIDANTVSVLREEGLSVAEEVMLMHVMNVPFADLTTADPPPPEITRTVRGIPDFKFRCSRIVNDLTLNDRMVTIRVEWDWKDDTYNHSISTVRRN